MVSRDLAAGSATPRGEIVAPDADEKLVRLWLHGRPATTRRAYERDALAFLAHAAKPIDQVVLADLQAWLDGMAGQQASKRRRVSAVKSLLSFGAQLGWLRFDVGKALRIPRAKDRLAERILPEEDVLRMIQGEPDARRRAFIRLLYLTGLRISEACALTWRDMTRRQQGGTANVFGKGGKTRPVPIGASLWKELIALRGESGVAAPVVPGQDGERLDLKAADRIVKRRAPCRPPAKRLVSFPPTRPCIARARQRSASPRGPGDAWAHQPRDHQPLRAHPPGQGIGLVPQGLTPSGAISFAGEDHDHDA